MIYNISQIPIALNGSHEIQKLECFEPFEISNVKEKFLAEFKPVESIEIPKDFFSRCTDYAVTKEDNEYCRYYYHSRIGDLIYAKSKWDWENSKIIIEYIPDYKEFLSESGNALFHIGLERILLRENRLIFHAACIDTTYGGVLFTGPSGAGKSTQADLWVKYTNAVLINGDRPILEQTSEGWNAWGSPYAGSSKCYVNDKCGIKTIVKVVKDSVNEVIRLKGSRAFTTVFSEITVNDWSREDVSKSTELVIDLINSVPVYELHCTKTEDAVDVLEKVLKGEVSI